MKCTQQPLWILQSCPSPWLQQWPTSLSWNDSCILHRRSFSCVYKRTHMVWQLSAAMVNTNSQNYILTKYLSSVSGLKWTILPVLVNLISDTRLTELHDTNLLFLGFRVSICQLATWTRERRLGHALTPWMARPYSLPEGPNKIIQTGSWVRYQLWMCNDKKKGHIQL